MKTRFIVSTLGCSMLAGVSLCFTAGCELGSGAFAEPSVRIKLAESAPTGGPPGPGPTPGQVETTSGGPGTFVGRVIFKGAPPSPKTLYPKGGAPKQPEVCSATGAIPNEELLVSAEGGIANVFVYLDKAPAGFSKEAPQTEPEPLTFDQKNCIFTTHAMIVRVGQLVKVLNSDGIAHNTHTFPNKNDQENMLIKANEKDGIELKFKKVEKFPFSVKCDLHAWMTAYQLPLDHPFGAVTDKDGKFKIENLPAGTYQFKVWHELGDVGKGGGFLESKYKVTVKPGDNEEVPIEVAPAKFGL